MLDKRFRLRQLKFDHEAYYREVPSLRTEKDLIQVSLSFKRKRFRSDNFPKNSDPVSAMFQYTSLWVTLLEEREDGSVYGSVLQHSQAMI